MSGLQVLSPAPLPQTVYRYAHVRASDQPGGDGGKLVVEAERPADSDSHRICAEILRRQIAELEASLEPGADLQRRIAAAELQVRTLMQERANMLQVLATLRYVLQQLDHFGTGCTH